MKIICVESNYAGASSEPVVFMKNDSSLLKGNKPYYLPYFSKEIVGGAELVYRISRLGRNIQEKFAHRYYDAVALGMGLTAADLQRRLMAEGKPWEISKAFDGSAVISDFVSLKKNIRVLSIIPPNRIFRYGCDDSLEKPFSHHVMSLMKYKDMKPHPMPSNMVGGTLTNSHASSM